MQAVATIAAIAAAIWVWLPWRQVQHGERVVLTAVLATVATPYGYSYDTVGLAVAVAYLFSTRANMPRLFLALVWLYPAIAHLVNGVGLGIGVLVPLSLSAWMLAEIRARERRDVVLTAADSQASSPRAARFSAQRRKSRRDQLEGQRAIGRDRRRIVPLRGIAGKVAPPASRHALPVKRHLAAKMQHPFLAGPADGHGAQARDMVVIGIDLHLDAAPDRWNTDPDRDVQHHLPRRLAGRVWLGRTPMATVLPAARGGLACRARLWLTAPAAAGRSCAAAATAWQIRATARRAAEIGPRLGLQDG